MKIEPIKDAAIHCHHQPGDPDCDCYPECPECGNSYDPEEGHICDSDFDSDSPFGPDSDFDLREDSCA